MESSGDFRQCDLQAHGKALIRGQLQSAGEECTVQRIKTSCNEGTLILALKLWYFMFSEQKPLRTTLPNSSCHIKAPELPLDLQSISWVLLTPELARGGQLDPQEPPLQDPMEAALGERAGRLWHGENCVINVIKQQLQAWERHTFSTGLAFKTKVTLIPEEQSWETLRKDKSSSLNKSNVKLYCITLKHHTLHPVLGVQAPPLDLNIYQNKQEKHPITGCRLWFL